MDRITGPIFLNDTISGQRYRDDILKPFFEELTDIECQNGYATSHTANETLDLIREIFENRVISLGMWP